MNKYIHKAFCLHEMGRTLEAKHLLLKGPASLLGEPAYHYNLGCYIALATSMLGNAFRQNYDYALLVAGDADYVPLVNEAKHHGRVVHGAFFERALAPELRLSFDDFFPLDVSKDKRVCRRAKTAIRGVKVLRFSLGDHEPYQKVRFFCPPFLLWVNRPRVRHN